MHRIIKQVVHNNIIKTQHAQCNGVVRAPVISFFKYIYIYIFFIRLYKYNYSTQCVCHTVHKRNIVTHIKSCVLTQS